MAENKNITRWMRRIKDAQKIRDANVDDWKSHYKAVYGDWYMEDGKRTKTNSFVSAQAAQVAQTKNEMDLLNAFLRNEIPSLILYRPEIFLTPTEQYAALIEKMKAGQAQQGYAPEAFPSAQDTASAYQDKVNEILNNAEGWESEVKAVLVDAHAALGVLKVTATATFKDPKAQTVADAIDTIEYDFSRVDPRKFLIDPRCKHDKSKARWVAEEIPRTLEELQESALYDAAVIAKLTDHLMRGVTDKEPWEIEVTLYEIYERKAGRLLVICEEWQDELLRDQETPVTMDKDPFKVLKFGLEIPGQFYNRPELASGVALQRDARDLRDHLRDLSRREMPKLGLREGLKGTEADRMLSDGTSRKVYLTNENDVWQIPNELSAGKATTDYLTVLQKDFDEAMGQNSQDRGIVGDAKFATEAQIAEANGKVREFDKLNTVRVFLESVVESLVFAVQHSGHAELLNLPVDVDLNIECDIESKSPRNKALDRKQLTEVLTTIASNPMFVQSPTLLDQILRDYDIREKDKIIQELTAAHKQAQDAAAAAATPPPASPQKEKGLAVSLALKHELLPAHAVDVIVDKVMGMDVPIDTGTAPVVRPTVPQGVSGNGQKPPVNTSPMAGTEIPQPGTGMMPDGGMTP